MTTGVLLQMTKVMVIHLSLNIDYMASLCIMEAIRIVGTIRLQQNSVKIEWRAQMNTINVGYILTTRK